MDDSDRTYAALLRIVATLRAQLALIAPDDPQRDLLYRDLLGCYHELIAIHRRQIVACRARLRPLARGLLGGAEKAMMNHRRGDSDGT